MEIIVITGMSGAGKSTVAKTLEDLGYFCIDNLPPQLLQGLIETVNDDQLSDESSNLNQNQGLALVMDVRSMSRFGGTAQSLAAITSTIPEAKIIFLEADEKVIISRYKLSRRNHPLAKLLQCSLTEAIEIEKRRLAPLRGISHEIIDTSALNNYQIREVLLKRLLLHEQQKNINIFVQSFGFKYGIPSDADLVLDVRFLPNPFYLRELRPLSGMDRAVRDYVLEQEECKLYLAKQLELLNYLLPLYQREGKTRLSLAVGCSGGRHRSVALADYIGTHLPTAYETIIYHRDIDTDEEQYQLN